MVSTFFLGACAAGGFVCHGDALLHEGLPLTILKGGPGCGKSTLMRAVGQAAEARGLRVSYLLCSSDPDSLDGVLIPELPVAFVDGTAPHVLEPLLCGGRMRYLNLGAFYDSAAMGQVEEDILSLQRANRQQYTHVTACLNAVAQMDEMLCQSAQAQRCEEELERISACLLHAVLRGQDSGGGECQRFLSAVTPRGLHLCAATPPALCERVYVLRDHYALAPRLLSMLLRELRRMDCERIVCYSSRQPEGAPAHILLPSAGVAIVSESAELPYTGPCFCRIDLDSTLPTALRGSLRFYLEERRRLLAQSVRHMAEAKRLHDCMEALCKPCVDFQGVSALTAQTLQTLFGNDCGAAEA